MFSKAFRTAGLVALCGIVGMMFSGALGGQAQPYLPVVTVDLIATPTSGPAPLTVVFSAMGQPPSDRGCPPATYRFDFGDGTARGTSLSLIAVHTYTKPGTYQAFVIYTAYFLGTAPPCVPQQAISRPVVIQVLPIPKITPQQIIDGVNQLIPQSKTYRPGDPGFDELQGTAPKNGLPGGVSAARSLDDGFYLLAFPHEGVRLFAARSLDDGVILGGQAGGTRLGAIELGRDYKLGSGPLKQGYYHIAAIYDPNNELDAKGDPKNETDFYLILAADLDSNDEIELWAFIGLPYRELAPVIGMMVDPALQVEFAQGVLLNLVAALLQ